MDREKAKQLLELCRPGHEGDRLDPALAEAIIDLETDPELEAWFDEQQLVDARISDQFQSIQAPAGLKDTILAGMHLHAANKVTREAVDTAQNATPFPVQGRMRSRRIASWVGIAAGVGIAALFLLAFALLYLPRETPTSAFTQAEIPPVIQFLSDEIDTLNPSKFDKRDPNPENLRRFLASNQSPAPQSLPAMLKDVPTIGCLTFQFEGARLSMICFKNGAVYHLVTAEKASFPGEISKVPQIFELQDKAFRLWTEGKQIKILTIHGSKNDFPEII